MGQWASRLKADWHVADTGIVGCFTPPPFNPSLMNQLTKHISKRIPNFTFETFDALHATRYCALLHFAENDRLRIEWDGEFVQGYRQAEKAGNHLKARENKTNGRANLDVQRPISLYCLLLCDRANTILCKSFFSLRGSRICLQMELRHSPTGNSNTEQTQRRSFPTQSGTNLPWEKCEGG